MERTREEVIEEIRRVLGPHLRELDLRPPRRAFLEVDPEDVPQATRLLFEDLGARFQTATGSDTPPGFEILYHWAFDRQHLVVTVRTRLPREDPEIESIAGICPAAEWIEREMWELLGIRVKNHPDLRHLLLDDDWPEGHYPLRRDYGKS